MRWIRRALESPNDTAGVTGALFAAVNRDTVLYGRAMKIKEQNEQRIVLAPTLRQRHPIFWLLLIVGAIWLAFFVFNAPITQLAIPIALLVVLGLYVLGELIGHRVIIDKTTESITIKKLCLLLILSKHVIPFSDVVNVRLEDHGGWLEVEGEAFPEMLEVRLNYHGKKRWQKVKIAQTTNTHDMTNLANEIARFIAK